MCMMVINFVNVRYALPKMMIFGLILMIPNIFDLRNDEVNFC